MNERTGKLRLEQLETRHLLAAVIAVPGDLAGNTALPESFANNWFDDDSLDGEIAARGFGISHESNLGQIGLAALNYESAVGRFPAQAIHSSDGQPLLSWRVAILPYLGHAELFAAFRHDEAWDSSHNLRLLMHMPEVFETPGLPFDTPVSLDQPVVREFKTVYQALVGPDTMVTGSEEGVRYGQALDGDQNTALFVQSALKQAVEWTKPQDLPFDPANPRNGLGWNAPEGFYTVLVDGSVHSVSRRVDDADLKNLVVRNDGEFVDFSEITPFEGVEENLADLALAILNFGSATQRLPPRAILDRFTGAPLLSWRVRILPYLGHSGLYDQFNRFEPWNSLHNLPLISKMPRVFADAELPNGLTKLLAFDHDDSAIANCPTPRCRGGTFGGITDGASQTALVVDAAVESSVPWTAPWDLTFEEDNPRAGLDFDSPDGVYVSLLDGSVVAIPPDVTDADLVNLVRRNDGEFVHFLNDPNQDIPVEERIREIMLGALNYESANRHLVPKAIASPAGEPLLSWRVALLPYLDGGGNLYNQFHLDEPWDSSHNIQLVELMPAVYSDADLPRGFTKLLGFVHPDSVLPADGSSIRIGHVRDGLSRTAFIADADLNAAVEWTRPADIVFDPANPLASVSDNGTSSFYIGMMNGSVRELPADISADQMRNLVLIDDGALVLPDVPQMTDAFNPWFANLYERRSHVAPDVFDRIFAIED